MSVQAISFVLSQDIRPSQLKFVLVALADNVGGDDGTVWPSIPTICWKTSQDRKTVIAALDDLESMGWLQDTGERCGETKQVKVYRIIGLPSDTRHYTYRLQAENGDFYIGVRSCLCEPAFDKYMGSGKWPRLMHGKLRKTVIQTYRSRAEADADETRFIRAAVNDPHCKNEQFRVRNSSAYGGQTVPSTGRVNSPEYGTQNRHIGTAKEPSVISITQREVLERMAQKKARPRSEQEVIEHCKAKGLPASDGEYFWNHWQGNGFKNNGKAMLDWRAVIVAWKCAGHCPSQKKHNMKPAKDEKLRDV